MFQIFHPKFQNFGIKNLSDCNWAQTHNHLVFKRTLDNFVKLTK